MKHLFSLTLLYLMLSIFPVAQAADSKPITINIELTLPKLEVHPYHKPFVAVWLETSERAPIETIAIWYDDAEWLKDLRQWWRKLGRKQHADEQLDGISGATQKPGIHTIQWQGTMKVDNAYLNIEVVREEGGRSYYREPIRTRENGMYTIAGQHEFGEIKIQIQPLE